MKERTRFEKMRGVPIVHGQFIKKASEANKSSSWQSYSRDALNLAGCRGFTDGLIGNDILIVEPFDFW